MTTTQTPFSATGWLKMTLDERIALVEPFYSEFATLRAQMEAAGKYPYNDDFRGKIAGIDPEHSGTSHDDEGTAIYLLQESHTVKRERVKLAAFIESGGYQITRESLIEQGVSQAKPLRGTAVVVGQYSGGTGYVVYEDVRVFPYGHRVVGIPKGKRTYGHSLSDGREIYFRPNGAKR